MTLTRETECAANLLCADSVERGRRGVVEEQLVPVADADAAELGDAVPQARVDGNLRGKKTEGHRRKGMLRSTRGRCIAAMHARTPS